MNEHDALKLYNSAQRSEKSFVELAVSSGAARAERVAQVAAEKFGLKLFDLQSHTIEKSVTQSVPSSMIRRYSALPVRRSDSQMSVAVADPTDARALDEFRFQSGLRVVPVLVRQDHLSAAIERINADSLADLDDQGLDDLWTSAASNDEESEEDEAQSASVIRTVNKVILDAIQKGASDIHFEPYEDIYRVRLRQDGVLSEITAMSPAMSPRIAARIKVMSRLDTAERRVPQDGRIKLNLQGGKAIDFRVSTCPTLFGEKIVMRLLDPSSAQMGISALGYEEHQRQIFEAAIQKPHGMVLVTGPTGSGKTVSLYTALNILNSEGRNISTAEDPAEINLRGINQVNVKPRVGLDFAAALRSFLRQDPDVIMVGEIRDLETAEISIKAAQTGHMVLSTVHTNDAPRTLTRLINMGVPSYNIADSVSLIIAQRLARRLCKHCKQPCRVPRQRLMEEGFGESELDSLTLYDANDDGCEHCTYGYKGRVGVYEVMPVTDQIGDIIMENGTARDIERQARKDGVIDLHEAGMNKMREGVVSLAEIHRVTVE